MTLDWCCIYKKSEEMVEHLLLHFSVARDLWSLVFALFGVSWVMPNTIPMLASWQGKFNNNRNIKIRKVVLLMYSVDYLASKQKVLFLTDLHICDKSLSNGT